MSTIKVTNIEHENTANGGIQLDNAGHVTVDGQQLPTAGALSNRNLFINGEQKVDQRNSGSAVSLSSAQKFVTDRWAAKINGGAATGQRVTDVPSGKGFVKSFKFDVTTADTGLGSNDEIWVQQRIEAQNLTLLRYGTSEAQSLTLSFWVKSALTGDYGFFIYQSDAARAYQTTYNISAANTWEYKTLTIPGDTAGTIDDNNGTGFEIRWYLGSGTNKAGTSNQNAWGTDFSNRHPGSTNLMASTSNNWLITGIQLEVGEKATPFEHKNYGDELERCRRYYQKFLASSAYTLFGIGTCYDNNKLRLRIPFTAEMRAAPTALEVSAQTHFLAEKDLNQARVSSSVVLASVQTTSAAVEIDSTANFDTGGVPYNVYSNNNTSAYMAFTAEL